LAGEGVMDMEIAKFHRRSIRLDGYDYSQCGAYFVTVCSHQRECLFADFVDGEIRLNDLGRIVDDEWQRSCAIRKEVELDVWCVMPNHIHGIVLINNIPSVGAYGNTPTYHTPNRSNSAPITDSSVRAYGHTSLRSPSKTIGAMIRGFKSAVTTRINEARRTFGAKIWRRNYYEHIIRNDDELNRIREYIEANPLHWEIDRENPNAVSKEGEPLWRT
jgi:putative transposase